MITELCTWGTQLYYTTVFSLKVSTLPSYVSVLTASTAAAAALFIDVDFPPPRDMLKYLLTRKEENPESKVFAVFVTNSF